MRRYLKRVPFLPSLLTLGNAFCGFLAIVKITDAARMIGEGEVTQAVWPMIELAGLLIFLAMTFDGLDGWVARLTRQTTEFGAQLDTLADVVTFGIAPAVIAKFVIDAHQAPATGASLAHHYLPYHPKIYYVCAALYVLFAVLRLARFNVEVRDPEEKSHREFEGLPSPAAATVVASLVFFLCAKDEKNSLSGLVFGEGIYRATILSLPGVLLGCGLLMVSRLPYPHVLNRLLRGRKSFPHLVVAVFLMILVVLEWQIVVVSLSFLYLMTGPVTALYRTVMGIKTPVIFEDEEEDEGPEFDEPAADEAEPPGVVEGPGARRAP